MTEPNFSNKTPKGRGKCQTNVSLSRYTSWRVGGNANVLYQPADREDLIDCLQQAKDVPLFWLGLGSNLLIRDGGLPGWVILTQGALMQMEHLDELTIKAEAGVACATMARFCARQNLEGLEFLAGIPGTIGGALRMNAGCHGGQTWEWVTSVEVINRQGDIVTRGPEDFQIAYRTVAGLKEDEWFLSGTFQLKKGDKANALQNIRALLDHRAKTQPTGEYSCGSVFKNPEGHFAAVLIEGCGLKGARSGDAEVSTLHANFIVNKGNANARDIENLIEMIEKKVLDETGISLEREVKIIGEKGDG